MRSWKSKEKQFREWFEALGLWPATRESTGKRGEDVEDIAWGPFSVEVKTRKTLPRWLFDWVTQSVHNCDGKLPIVVAHEDYLPMGSQLVVMRLDMFVELVSRVHERENT